ncbi:MAG TPA: EF-hand domain-containing protein [Methylibium sp.]|jgi:hypothetical protein|nr:EF-hand domain-containing protein [Methylibium sp.]
MKTILVPAFVALALVAGSAVAAPGKPETRDWSAVDTNRDGLVSPEEMEAFLAADKAKATKK